MKANTFFPQRPIGELYYFLGSAINVMRNLEERKKNGAEVSEFGIPQLFL